MALGDWSQKSGGVAMATVESGIVESEILIQPFDRLITASDLEAFPAELPSGPIDYELDNGRLVFIMVPPGNIHGAVQLRIGTQLMTQGELKGHGEARTEVGVILWRNPDRVVTPDALFVAKKSLPIRESAEGYLETIPELVVEVRSKNDSAAYVRRKVDHYLKAGVELVLVADPTSKAITVHQPKSEPVTLGIGDTLTLPSLIPDFSLRLADIFRE
jgi:Uma2 family endonuclease